MITDLDTEPLKSLTKKEVLELGKYLEAEEHRRGRAHMTYHGYILCAFDKERKPYKALRRFFQDHWGYKKTKRALLALDCPFEDLPLLLDRVDLRTKAVIKWRLNLCK